MAAGVRADPKALRRMAAATEAFEQSTNSGAVRHYRQRHPRRSAGNELQWGEVTSTATAGSWTAPETGMVQLKRKKEDGTGYEDDGTPVEFWNVYPLEFATGYVGKFDVDVSPVEIVVATCTPAP